LLVDTTDSVAAVAAAATLDAPSAADTFSPALGASVSSPLQPNDDTTNPTSTVAHQTPDARDRPITARTDRTLRRPHRRW
jgi:hypothetical protein